MADTPLHLHPSVLHLMGTEHWPNGKYGSLKFTGDQWGGWYFGDIDGAHSWIEEAIAHSLITLAAVRGLWAKGYMVRQWEFPGGINTKACACYDYDHSHFFGPYGTIWLQPTEPLAILAAYQATVMEQGAPDAKPE